MRRRKKEKDEEEEKESASARGSSLFSFQLKNVPPVYLWVSVHPSLTSCEMFFSFFLSKCFLSFLFAEVIRESDLIFTAKSFVSQFDVEELVAAIFEDCVESARFVRETKRDFNDWSSVALDALRGW